MKKSIMDEPTRRRKPHASRGVSMLELILVMSVIAIISTFAVLGITRSRNSINLQNSVRIFASYIEKARLDAIRRHDTTNVDITGPNTYTVTMDFDGAGTVGVRTFTLERGVVFTDSTNTAYTVDGSGNVSSSNGEAVSWADFNWRGRTSQCTMPFRMQNSNNGRSAVQVAGSGDVTIDTSFSTPAAVTTTNVNATADVAPSSVVTGNFSHFELNPCGVSGGGGTPIAPPTATCAGGSIGSNVGSVSVRKNSGSTASVSITVTGPGTITTVPNSNLQVTPATQSVTSSTGGTFSFSIKSITRTRASNPPFTVVFNNPCNSLTIYVSVNN
jgi:prepilin-type N-terminal cleavage/methylation domain-containing protein